MLLYEHDDQVYRAHLDILNHINGSKVNGKLTLGAMGLLVDIVLLATLANSASDIGPFNFNWGSTN